MALCRVVVALSVLLHVGLASDGVDAVATLPVTCLLGNQSRWCVRVTCFAQVVNVHYDFAAKDAA